MLLCAVQEAWCMRSSMALTCSLRLAKYFAALLQIAHKKTEIFKRLGCAVRHGKGSSFGVHISRWVE